MTTQCPSSLPLARSARPLVPSLAGDLLAVQREFARIIGACLEQGGFPEPFRACDPGLLRAFTVEPKLDVRDTGQEFRLEAELPGVDGKDIELLLDENGLILRGEKKLEREGGQAGFRHYERVAGSFERFIPLPASAVKDRVEATFRQGVLTVVLPKAPGAVPARHRVPIAAA